MTCAEESGVRKAATPVRPGRRAKLSDPAAPAIDTPGALTHKRLSAVAFMAHERAILYVLIVLSCAVAIDEIGPGALRCTLFVEILGCWSDDLRY
jgi:hypothetical protein